MESKILYLGTWSAAAVPGKMNETALIVLMTLKEAGSDVWVQYFCQEEKLYRSHCFQRPYGL